MIRYLEHNEIDLTAWDESILKSENARIYGMSWYLNRICPGWQALVEDDYQSVMPLFSRKKMGIQYLYQPFFCQQSGIFSSKKIDAKITGEFLSAIPKKFRYIDIHLNAENETTLFQARQNQFLILSESLDKIVSGYSDSHRKNLRRARRNNLSINQISDFSVFSSLLDHADAGYLTSEMKNTIFEILNDPFFTDKIEIFGAFDNTRLLTACLFLIFNKTAYLPVSATISSGKEKKAMFLILDHVIRHYAGKLEKIDFSGSEIRGVAEFNAGFGAKAEKYPVVKINRLPVFLRWIKR